MLATSHQKPDAIVQGIAERQERLSALDARLRATKAAPAAIELELRRMEAESKERISDLRGMIDRNPEEARKVLQAVFEGNLRCSPVELPEGRRFQIEGTATVGKLLTLEFTNSEKFASPAGFYTLLNSTFGGNLRLVLKALAPPGRVLS